MKLGLQVYSKTLIKITRLHRVKIAVMILNAADHIQDGTGGTEASMMQRELKQHILKG
jgi:hypothetical protein